jgi:hypothetical protein
LARVPLAFAAAVLLIGGPVALAQSSGRFAMHPADGGGMVRLDTETGAVSICKGPGGQWTCEAVADDRAAFEKEIARLARENDELRASVKRLEQMAGLPPETAPGKPAEKSPGYGLPGPEDVDRAMTYLNSMLKKFREKLKELEGIDGKRTERL